MVESTHTRLCRHRLVAYAARSIARRSERVALSELEQALLAKPQLDSIPWYQLSHASRIVRWLFSQPPRVQTMLSVRAALENAGTSSDMLESDRLDNRCES